MIDIKTIAKICLMTLLLAFSVSLAGVLAPRTALAAGCSASPSGAREEQQQAECVTKYKQECKKSYGNAFCNSLTVTQINRCATDTGTGFRKACIEQLRDDFRDSDSSTKSVGAARAPADCKVPEGGSFQDLNRDNCKIIDMIVVITNILAGVAGLVIVASIIFGGIQYSSAGADPGKVQAAKHRLIISLEALALLIFGYAFLQWVVPGGIF